MNIVLILILFGVVVLITHFLEGVTGFGCTALALPFCTLLVGIRTAVPVLFILAWILALYVVIIDHKNIVWKQYFKIILFVGIGLPIGILMFSRFPEGVLKKILGVFMVVVALRGIYISFKKTGISRKLPDGLCSFFLFLGGIAHGAFASGGPLVVIYATENLKDKGQFRATLCMLWFTLNTVIIVKDLASSVLTVSMLQITAVSLPFLFVGMILGNMAHGKIKEAFFTKLIYIVLLFSGAFMFI